MIRKICFTKMVASGNDFIIIDRRRPVLLGELSSLAIKICDRKLGVGSDGMLILENSKKAGARMRIFNPDGSEPSMCGNGLRCSSLWLKSKLKNQKSKIIMIETKAGIIRAKVNKDKVKINMTKPRGIRSDLAIKIGGRRIRVDFINTGVPHAVIFVHGIDDIDVVGIGRQIRLHKRFMPEGTNVDFVEAIDEGNIKLRTYERGVEDETLACGTGSVAAALMHAVRFSQSLLKRINVQTKSGEILEVEFKKIGVNRFQDIWLKGKARTVYSGVYYV